MATIYDEVGNTIYSRNKEEKGIIQKIQSRYCAACGISSLCYVVKWNDGKITKPCVNGVGINAETKELYII